MAKLLLMLALLMPSIALADQCSVVVGDKRTGEYNVITGECFSSEAQALKLGFISQALEKSGCCSKHKGVASCDSRTKRYRCKDGTISPTCKCTPPKAPSNSCKR